LVFPPKGTEVPAQDQDDKRRLIIYTVNGIIPEDREGNSNLISDRDRLGTVVFTLAAYLTQGQIYRAKRTERKVLLLDESSVLRSIPSGKMLMDKSSTDSRKNNLRVLAVGQNVSQYADSTRTNALENLVGAAFVGAMQGSEIGPALSLVQAPQGQGYEEIISSLRPAEDRREVNGEDDQLRQFVFWDGDDTERIYVDANGQPEFKRKAQSGPDQIRLQENEDRLAAATLAAAEAAEAAAAAAENDDTEQQAENSEAPRRLRRQPREELAYAEEQS
jgi:hypothetical protein